uniref:Uncharacterized protein n=1 Tax=Solanum lycopersicum TaxID=4081 RepID=A0A3Q7JL49_SOLLC
MRVDQMVKAGLVDEVRQIFITDADYTKGIRRSVVFPEIDRYLREETNIDTDDEAEQMIIQASISSIKRNTRMLICNQLDKIQRLISKKMWSVHHIIATDVFKEDFDEAWTNTVLQKCLVILKRFLKSDFKAEIFCLQVVVYIQKVLKSQRVPIIIGGSNSYIEKHLKDPMFMFIYKYDSFFILIDVEQSVLNNRVDMRVDQMVKAGLVDEVRQIFIPDADYTKGIRRSFVVPETDRYFREETNVDGDDESKQMIIQASIQINTRILICNQLDRIQRLISEKIWLAHHIITIDVFKEDRDEDLNEAWTNSVLQPCLDIVKRFLKNYHHNFIIECT